MANHYTGSILMLPLVSYRYVSLRGFLGLSHEMAQRHFDEPGKRLIFCGASVLKCIPFFSQIMNGFCVSRVHEFDGAQESEAKIGNGPLLSEARPASPFFSIICILGHPRMGPES